MPARKTDTIVALATPPGVGAIAIVRVSGEESISLVNGAFPGKDLSKVDSHTVHFGTIRDEEDLILDEVLVTVYRGPNSYTKEDSIEISTHGSPYIVESIIKLLIRLGARHAKAGEFTQRAFLNGQFDLAQAEAVADLIHSDSESSHRAAMNQMRGGFSASIKELREKLIHFASMIELELDFSEEDVEFADRDQLASLINQILAILGPLLESFDLGNVIKNGVPTVIAGKPNAGKSTLLNALLQEEKAIVSDIPGTTRDFIEDEIVIQGISFRFIDTAGLREATDAIEAIGVERTKEQMSKASVIIYLFDLTAETSSNIRDNITELQSRDIPFIAVGNKIDKATSEIRQELADLDIVYLSAASHEGIEELKSHLIELVNADGLREGGVMVTNLRHYENLIKTRDYLQQVISGINAGISNDLLAEDIRQALWSLGEITGEITTDDLLENIFSKFCIGK